MIVFSVSLGFSIAAVLGGLFGNGRRMHLYVLGALTVTTIAVSLVDPVISPTGSVLTVRTILSVAFTDHTPSVLAGAVAALLVIIANEGLLDDSLGPVLNMVGMNPPAPQPSALGARDELLARLCLYAFQESRRSVLSDLEFALSARAGHRQRALHAIAAPGSGGHRITEPKRLIRTYRKHFDPQLSSAPLIYGVLCRLAVATGAATAGTTKRLHVIGHALELDRGQMNRALSTA